MKSHIGRVLVLGALLIPLSACPAEPTITSSLWLFTVDGTTVGLYLYESGNTVTPNPLPPEADNSFIGTLTFTLVNNQYFKMTQVSGANTWNYQGTLNSNTSIINGMWVQTSGGTGSGTWFAERL